MTTCWYLWTWQNKSIFEADFGRPSNPTLVTHRFIKNIEDITLDPAYKRLQKKETIYIGWKRHQMGWVKLNTDGAWKGVGTLARCGDLLRDSDGRWIKGYTKKIGSCDVFHAELWGIYLGLDRA